MTSIQANPSDHADDQGHDDHGHDHDPNLAHHFESMEQQMDSGKLGMWLFLATEVLFFGGLFAAYAVLRARAEANVREFQREREEREEQRERDRLWGLLQ